MSIGKRSLIAFLLALLVPGLGQIYNGQIMFGILFALLWLVFVCLTGLLGLLLTFDKAIACAICIWTFQIALAIYASIVASRQAREKMLPQGTLRLCASVGVLSGVLVFFGFTFPERIPGVRGYMVSADSMSPALVMGDRFAVDLKYYKTHRPRGGEIIAFKMPATGEIFVKRVIAVEGDVIEGGPAGTIVNDQLLLEPFLLHGSSDPKFGPVKIPPNELFVMGDNRANSYDSRYFGFVNVGDVVGKALYVYYSSSDKGRIGHTIEEHSRPQALANGSAVPTLSLE